jgi:hypothetical protein
VMSSTRDEFEFGFRSSSSVRVRLPYHVMSSSSVRVRHVMSSSSVRVRFFSSSSVRVRFEFEFGFIRSSSMTCVLRHNKPTKLFKPHIITVKPL